MKHLPIIILFLALAGLSHSGRAQNFYFSLGGGYGHSAAPNLFSGGSYESNNGTRTYEREKGSGSFGRGISFGVSGGYAFNPRISAELGLNYLMGFKSTYSGESSDGFGSYSYSTESKASLLRINPSLRFNAGEGKTIPYMKAGAVIGMAQKLIIEEKESSSGMGGGGSFKSTDEYTGRVSLGFSGALGLEFSLGEKLGLYTELNMITHSWAPARSEITAATEDGVDILPDMSTRDKETEYTDKYTENDNDNEPAQESKYFLPLSSIGLQVGLIFKL